MYIQCCCNVHRYHALSVGHLVPIRTSKQHKKIVSWCINTMATIKQFQPSYTHTHTHTHTYIYMHSWNNKMNFGTPNSSHFLSRMWGHLKEALFSCLEETCRNSWIFLNKVLWPIFWGFNSFLLCMTNCIVQSLYIYIYIISFYINFITVYSYRIILLSLQNLLHIYVHFKDCVILRESNTKKLCLGYPNGQ